MHGADSVGEGGALAILFCMKCGMNVSLIQFRAIACSASGSDSDIISNGIRNKVCYRGN